MNRVRRAFLVLAVSLVVTLIAIAVRLLNTAGMFTDFKPGFAGSCRQIAGVAGVRDLAVDGADRLLFAAATNTRALPGHPDRRDGIYVLPLSGELRVPARLDGTPHDFHPRGISLARGADGSLTLMTVNRHAGGGSSIDVFSVAIRNGMPTLTQTGTIESDELISPDAIAALDQDRFYVTNDHGSRTWIGRFLENYVLLPRGNVLYFDGNVFRVVAQRLNIPRGIALSPDNLHLYVAEFSGRSLMTFERSPVSGSLKESGELSLPAAPDSIKTEEGGSLVVSAHPKLFALMRFAGDRAERAPSEIFRVALSSAAPVDAATLYASPGNELAAASAVAVSGHDLFLGSALDNGLLDCSLPQ
jgi:arylesterase/paraoxonase